MKFQNRKWHADLKVIPKNARKRYNRRMIDRRLNWTRTTREIFKKVYFPKRDNWCKVQQYKKQQQLKYLLLRQCIKPYCIYIPTLQLLPQPSNILLWRYMQPSRINATNKPVVCVRTKRLPTTGTASANLQRTPLQEHWENAGAARAYQMNPPSGSC